MANIDRSRRGAPHVLAAAGWDVDARRPAGAPRIRVLVGARAPRHDRPRAAPARARHARASSASTSTTRGGCAPTRSRDALAAARRADDRLRAGRQREHAARSTRSRAIADARREARRVVARRRRVRPVGRGQRRRFAHLVDGVERADSWATDAHKWLNVPYDCGVVVLRDPEAHRAAMAVAASYLQRGRRAERDRCDWVPEFSRRARGFAGLRRAARARPQRRRRAGRPLLRPRAPVRRPCSRRTRRRDPERRRPQPGARALRRRRRGHHARSRRVQARRHVLARRHGVARPSGDADLGLELRTTARDVERSAAAILDAFKNLQREPIEERWAPSG